MYNHYPTNWWEMYREGENNPTNWWDLVYKNMVEIIDVISHKLSGQYVRLQHNLERFGFTT